MKMGSSLRPHKTNFIKCKLVQIRKTFCRNRKHIILFLVDDLLNDAILSPVLNFSLKLEKIIANKMFKSKNTGVCACFSSYCNLHFTFYVVILEVFTKSFLISKYYYVDIIIN